MDTFLAKRMYLAGASMEGRPPESMTQEGFTQGPFLPFVIREQDELLDVDTPFDLELVRALMESRQAL